MEEPENRPESRLAHPTTAEEAARLHNLVESAQALIENGQSLIEAELTFQKARAGFVLRRAKGILALGALVLALLFFMLMALIVGLLLALAPLLSPWGAMGAVIAGLLLVTGLCALGVVRRISMIRKALKGSASKGDAA